jgi:arylsulfatase A-like enzyme
MKHPPTIDQRQSSGIRSSLCDARHALLTLCVLCAFPGPSSAETQRPNVVLFMVDDMGWMDCGAYGSEYYKTPNIDRLAKQSMRFTDAYALPLCSPTRASILTGQYSARHGITTAGGHTPPRERVLAKSAPPNHPLLMPESKTYLDPAHITLAEVLRDVGYRTAHIGKWHLGLTEPHWPEANGFEFAFHSEPSAGPPDYFSPYGVVPPGSKPDKSKGQKVGTITDGPDGEHITDRTTDEAIKFVEAHRNEPFYLNYWLFSVHGPWQHKEAYTAEFAKTTDPRGKQGNPVMASMLRSVDEGLGRLLDKLDELKLTEKTIFVFYSDNGGNVHSWTPDDPKIANVTPTHPLYETIQSYRKWSGGRPPTDCSPLRDGKGTLYEGGQRVPLIVRWPGVVRPGSVSAAVVGAIDLYPTILDALGIPKPKAQILDGESILPALKETGAPRREAYFTWFPHQIPGVSVRKGDWKLIRRFKEMPEDYEGLHELFNLKDDLGETTNLAAKHPEKVAELDALIDAFVKDTGCLYPVPNPAYKPRPAAPATRTSP